jgi:branched-chain amino acid aminotransferase
MRSVSLSGVSAALAASGIDRTELLVADEIAICGTLAELVLVKTSDGLPLNENSNLLRSLQDRFFRAARNIEPHPFVELTLVEPKAAANSVDARTLAKTT